LDRLDGKTPIELWIDRKPYVSYLRIIGSKAYTLINEKRSKFDKKRQESVLVDYASKQKAYRVWLRGTRKVIVNRDVKIVESKQQTVKIAGTDDERDDLMDNDSQSKDKRQSDLQLLSNDGDRLINSDSTNNISARTCSK